MLEKGPHTAKLIRRAHRVAAVLLAVFASMAFFGSGAAWAQTPSAEKVLTEAGAQTGLGTADLPTIIGRIIYILLSFIGVILLGLLLWAGYTWMTAGGDAKKIDEAKSRIRNAVIGLVIIASSFAITNFILRFLSGATETGGGVSTEGALTEFAFPGSAGSLGRGIIEYHVPSRDATGIPRNTSIIITFKEPIKLSTIIKDYNDNGTPADLSDDVATSTTIGLNTDVFKIFPSGQRENVLSTAQVRVRFTADRKTFVLRPVELLGNPSSNTPYTAQLLTGLLLENGQPAFRGSFSGGYRWQFEVSTFVDNTPPQITSVIPIADGTYAPNIVVQVNFNEAIDPTSAAGIFRSGSGFPNLQVRSTPTATPGAASRPDGEFKISNRYQTVEFVPEQACGTNSCGRTVYCLPTDSNITVEARSATLSANPPEALITASGFDGVVDIASNALDGNRNGRADGPATDGFTWNFTTTRAPNLAAPAILSHQPDVSASNIPVDQVPSSTFDTVLQAASVNSNSSYLLTNEPEGDTFWYAPYQTIVNRSGAPARPEDRELFGAVAISHRMYQRVTDRTRTAPPVYYPTLTSDLQNVYQNCFKPAASRACRATEASPNCCDGTPRAGANCGYPERTP